MPVTASELRQNIYRLLDKVAQTGVPLEIVRRGKILRIVPAAPVDRLGKLVAHEDYLKCDPEDIVHLDWSEEWRP